MKRIIATILLLTVPSLCFGAIAFDNSLGRSFGTSAALTFSYTTAGTNRYLNLCVAGGSTDIVTGAKYNGVSMTLAQKIQLPGDRWNYQFVQANPAVGANTVEIDSSASQLVIYEVSSYTGAQQTDTPDKKSTNSINGTSLTSNLTTIADNSWAVLCGANSGGDPMSAGTGTTLRDSGASGQAIFDSNAAIHPAGSTNLIFTQSPTDDMIGNMISIAPFSAVVASPVVGTFFGLFGYWN